MHGLGVAADERSAEVDVLQVVLFSMKVGDLTDIVAGILVSMRCDREHGLGNMRT